MKEMRGKEDSGTRKFTPDQEIDQTRGKRKNGKRKSQGEGKSAGRGKGSRREGLEKREETADQRAVRPLQPGR